MRDRVAYAETDNYSLTGGDDHSADGVVITSGSPRTSPTSGAYVGKFAAG